MNICTYTESKKAQIHVKRRKLRNPKFGDEQKGSKKIFLLNLQ